MNTFMQIVSLVQSDCTVNILQHAIPKFTTQTLESKLTYQTHM